MGNRTVGLRHAFGPVVEATGSALQDGSSFLRVAAIDAACGTVPSPEMVKFCEGVSSANTAAVRVARA
jgi:glutamate-1-semialdehyde 2,1-aminomutase